MEFFIKKNATLPVLKLQVVKDGRSDYNNFMNTIELSSIFFSMVDVENGISKISTRPAGFVEKLFEDPNAEPEYYIYYQFTNKDTNRVGRYEGQFMLRNDDGVLILPIREKLFINIQESFISDELPYDSCYTSEFPCCVNGPYTTTTTTTPCPTCPPCPPITTTTTTLPITTTTTTSQCLPCPSISELPEPGTYKVYSNGLTVSGSATGTWLYKYCNVQDIPPVYICDNNCLDGANFSNTKMFFPNASFGNTTIYTLDFSYPVNDIALVLWSYTQQTIDDVYYREIFTFTTNTGTNTPTITSCNYCCGIISGNTIIAQDDGNCWPNNDPANGSGTFYFNNSEPFTQLTITVPNWGNESGIMPVYTSFTGFMICEEEFPTTTTTTTTSSIETIYLSFNVKTC